MKCRNVLSNYKRYVSVCRQLMSGVDNLRVLASTLENVDRIEDWTKDFLLDFEEDNATGPAI